MLFRKLRGGYLVRAHIADANRRKAITGKTFQECLKDSIDESYHNQAQPENNSHHRVEDLQ